MLSLPYNLVLGSKSPRRREILDKAGLKYHVVDIDYEEVIPAHGIEWQDIPLYLAQQKAIHAKGIQHDELLITADTLVFLDGKVIGKPKDKQDAFETLKMLSGKMHKVITGVCLTYDAKTELISDTSKVYFKYLSNKDIHFYIDNYDVLDKAGAYGAQDWMGLIGIEKIEGSYFNVMGLPIHKVYEALKNIEKQKLSL